MPAAPQPQRISHIPSFPRKEQPATETFSRGELRLKPEHASIRVTDDLPMCEQGSTLRPQRSLLSLMFGVTRREPPLFVRKRSCTISTASEGEKAAAATCLELTIMGSALVLTLGLQIQEVVGSRGGLQESAQRVVAQHIFVISSTISFISGFYSIVTAAVMLLSIVSTPST